MTPFENQTLQISRADLLLSTMLSIAIPFMTSNMNDTEMKTPLEVHCSAPVSIIVNNINTFNR